MDARAFAENAGPIYDRSAWLIGREHHVTVEGYLLCGLGIALVLAIVVFDTLKRKRFADALARMTPEQREAALREARAMRSVFSGGWGQG